MFPLKVGEINPLKPELSQVLHSILDEGRSNDETKRLLAIRRFEDIFKKTINGSEPLENMINATAFVLERGLMTTIKQGLDASVNGPWFLFPSARDLGAIGGQVPILIKPVIYIAAVEVLALDTRTVRYMLKECPRLPAS